MLMIIVKLNVFNAQSEQERRKKKKTDTNKSESRQIGDKQVQIDRGTVGEEWDTKKKARLIVAGCGYVCFWSLTALRFDS